MEQVEEIKEKAAKGTRWSLFAEIFAKCIAPIVNMILARLLTPEAFGVVATVSIITSFADLFTDAGFQKFLIQHDFKDEKELNNCTNVAFWTNFFISCVLWGVIALFSDELARLVGNPGCGKVIIISSLSVPLTAFSSIQMARYKRSFEFKPLFFIRIVSCVIPFFITVPIAFFSRSYWALVIGSLLSTFANAVVLTVFSKWKPKFYYSVKYLKDMFSYSWWILMESILVWLAAYVDVFIVGSYLSEFYVGVYKTSMSTVNQIMALITATTSVPMFVALSRLKNDREQMMKTYYNFIEAVAIIAIPLGIGIFMYKDLVTEILLGAQWREGADFIGLWGLMSSICLVFGTYCNGVYNAVGKTKLSLFSQVLHLVTLIPVLLIAAKYGFKTLCVARSLVRIELVFVQLIIMKIFMKTSISKLFIKIIPSVIGTVVMVACILLLRTLWKSTALLLLSVVISIVVYLLVERLFFKKEFIGALKTFGVYKTRHK